MTEVQTIKQKLQNMKTKPHQLFKLIVLLVVALSLPFGGFAYAQTLQEQINTLNTQNSGLQAQRQNLIDEADSLEAVIASLQAQINELQAQIDANEARKNDLLRQIAEAEAEIIKQRELLGDNIREMYLEGDISTLEMLASSKDLSEFLDREQYRTEVQNKVKTTLDRINELKAQLEAQKIEVEKILVDQRTIQAQLDVQRAEQTRLLALNESQQNELRSQIASNSSKIADLRRQQAAANARLFGGRGTINVPDTTGYPWAGVAFPNTSADPWGMYKRQCVSYTAWKVWKSGRHMPYWGGHGNANQWDDNARAAGIPVDGNPRVGDVAVSNAGYYGHVMYVEAVYGDGTIYVSQYNANWGGTYSEARVGIGSLVFIHF
jgi:surface antigen/regulator of replication initiation timing